MGLSIHYSGVIKDKSQVPVLVNEIVGVCEDLGWTYHKINNRELNGIVFSPKECEPLFFTFNKEGQIVSPILLQYNIEPATTISVKTQFAGIDAHIAIIKLIKHLNEKYFSEFELMDEGYYWETDDEKILQQQFNNYEAAFDIMSNALKNLESIPGETPDALAERIIKLFDQENQKED